MQLLADLLDKRIVRPPIAEASALGVARLASEALDLAPDESWLADADCFEPRLPAEQRDRIRRNWNAAIARATAPGCGTVLS
jgi:glycerol kinase